MARGDPEGEVVQGDALEEKKGLTRKADKASFFLQTTSFNHSVG